MARVIFWEKPGCVNNRRQKDLLTAAGHRVEARDIRAADWSAGELRRFFGNRPKGEWFNRAAPAVKEGRVRPDLLSEADALALMRRDPLLIRRPLMEAEGTRRVGFDQAAVDAWLGLSENTGEDLQSCPNPDGKGCDDRAA